MEVDSPAVASVADPVSAASEVPVVPPTGEEEEQNNNPDSFAAAVDIIVPPPDILTVVDSTAKYVARLGVGFESAILTKHNNSKKFHFLKPDNPYYAYYQFRLKNGDAPLPGEGNTYVLYIVCCLSRLVILLFVLFF